jgi:hypothetical protein
MQYHTIEHPTLMILRNKVDSDCTQNQDTSSVRVYEQKLNTSELSDSEKMTQELAGGRRRSFSCVTSLNPNSCSQAMTSYISVF